MSLEGAYYSDCLTSHPHLGDNVNHPAHYKQYEGFEVIDITKQMDFLTGNSIKYILRAPFKGKQEEDLEKAIWYLNKRLEELNAKK